MTSSSKPVWLLDIDGVLNAIRRDGPDAWPKGSYIVGDATATTGGTWPMRIAKPVVDFIIKVHEQGLAEVRWHTTWQHSASEVAKVAGLPEFPVQLAPEFSMDHWTIGQVAGSWWKLPAVWRVAVRELRPVVWTDDDILRQTTRSQRNALHRAGDVLVVSPKLDRGLTSGDLNDIESFLFKFQGENA